MKYHPMGTGAVTAPALKRTRMSRFKAFAGRTVRFVRDLPLYLYVLCYLTAQDAVEAAERVHTYYRSIRSPS